MNDTDRIEALVGRVARLENQNRWFRRVGAILVVVMIAVVLSGQSPATKGKTKRVIEAEAFILRDKNDVMRGTWTTSMSRVQLNLSGQSPATKGKTKRVIEAEGFILRDENGVTRGSLATHIDGTRLTLSHDGGMVILTAHASHASLLLTTLKEGQKETANVFLYAFESGETGSFYRDKNGVKRAQLNVDPDGSPTLSLYDNKETERARLGCGGTVTTATGVEHTHPESALLLFDKDNKVLFEAPQASHAELWKRGLMPFLAHRFGL